MDTKTESPKSRVGFVMNPSGSMNGILLAGDAGIYLVSIEKLAADAGISISQAVRGMRALERNGYISPIFDWR